MSETRNEIPPAQTIIEILNHIIFRHPSLAHMAATVAFNAGDPELATVAQNYLRAHRAWRHEKSGFFHQHVVPYATYAPWLRDAPFMGVYDKVKAHTLVDIYRCHELWTLAKQAARVDGDILEVGVWRGGTGALLAAAAKASGKRVYLADTFQGVVKAGEKDTNYVGGEHADTSIDVVRGLLAELGLDNVQLLQGIFPEETQGSVAGGIALLHCDVDVYASARDVVEWAFPRLAVGSVLVFDDYGFHGCEGVTTFCEELRGDDRFLFVHNLNGHAVFVRIA